MYPLSEQAASITTHTFPNLGGRWYSASLGLDLPLWGFSHGSLMVQGGSVSGRRGPGIIVAWGSRDLGGERQRLCLGQGAMLGLLLPLGQLAEDSRRLRLHL